MKRTRSAVCVGGKQLPLGEGMDLQQQRWVFEAALMYFSFNERQDSG